MVQFGIRCIEEILRLALGLYILAPFLYIFLVFIGATD